MRTSRATQSAETRAAILAAAEAIFAGAGLSGARMDAIAARARVNKALLYYYFASKESLYEAVVEEHFREFNRQALELLHSRGSAREVLLQYVSLHFDFISGRHQSAPLFQQFMMRGGPRAARLIREYFLPRSQAVAKLLERGMRAGEFRRTDGFHTAVSIVSLIVFYFSAAPVLELLGQRNAYSAGNLRVRKREVLDFIRHALFVNPEAPMS
jgi:TetR/AcrR family transcriptional regulator